LLLLLPARSAVARLEAGVLCGPAPAAAAAAAAAAAPNLLLGGPRGEVWLAEVALLMPVLLLVLLLLVLLLLA
jgi:hypothetical protein